MQTVSQKIIFFLRSLQVIKFHLLVKTKDQIKRIPFARKTVISIRNKMQKKAPKTITVLDFIKHDQQMHKKADPKHLVFISPLPPAKSGIADYSLALLQELQKLYTITIVCHDKKALNTASLKNFSLMTPKEYLKKGNALNRHMYHFGNSYHHTWMEPLLDAYPGTIVLHDIFLGGYIHAKNSGNLTQIIKDLFDEEGYDALKMYTQTDLYKTLWNYPLYKKLLSKADGVIVHSNYAQNLIKADIAVQKAPFLKTMPNQTITKAQAKQNLNLSKESFIVCTFGFIGPTKCSKELIQAWQQSTLSKNPNAKLVFIGSLPLTAYGEELLHLSKKSAITFTQYCQEDTYKNYLQAADIVVQLRQDTRGESSAALFDALSFANATIININGSFDEIPPHTTHQLPDNFTQDQLQTALEKLYTSPSLREELSLAAKHYVQTQHDPKNSAKIYADYIEQNFHQGNYSPYRAMLHQESTQEELKQARTPSYQKNLFVDVSDLANCDLRTGIQRVVRSILHYLIQSKQLNYTIKPVKLKNGRYIHAHDFTCKFLDMPYSPLNDEAVHMQKGDIFLGLDLYVGQIGLHPELFAQMQKEDVKIWFIIYDILPILFPDFFPAQTEQQFQKWLHVIANYAYSVACISNSVAKEVTTYLAQHPSAQRQTPLQVKSFSLGSDIDNTHPTKGITPSQSQTLNTLKNKKFALMVGTIEPRKGHSFTLDVFDTLYIKENFSLVIVGKQGWMVEDIIAKITSHPLYNKQLFWFDTASDELLETLYGQATSLIAASQGEGFGLPLIEAARYDLPIIARDIPVFKEVAKSHAYYFQNTTDISIVSAQISYWLHLYQTNTHPISTPLKGTTWKASTQELISIMKLKTT